MSYSPERIKEIASHILRLPDVHLEAMQRVDSKYSSAGQGGLHGLMPEKRTEFIEGMRKNILQVAAAKGAVYRDTQQTNLHDAACKKGCTSAIMGGYIKILDPKNEDEHIVRGRDLHYIAAHTEESIKEMGQDRIDTYIRSLEHLLR